MIEVSDEQLMAYADGELDGPLAVDIEHALREDAALRGRLQRFSAPRQRVAVAFETVLREPVPDHLVELVRGHASSAIERRRDDARVLPFVARKPTADMPLPRPGPRPAYRPHRVAASVLLFALGCSTGYLARPSSNPGEAPSARQGNSEMSLRLASFLEAVLEAAPSGVLKKADSGQPTHLTANVRGTFKARDGRFCREYKVAIGEGQHLAGVACRQDGLGWVIENQARVAVVAKPASGIRPAAANATSPIDETVDSLIDGGLLDPGEEAELLKRGWAGGGRK
ncbi:MAG: hypothetical protein R3D44_09915 [Hyphomicrobiaceae bacterium]